jgi:hypothetical protein
MPYNCDLIIQPLLASAASSTPPTQGCPETEVCSPRDPRQKGLQRVTTLLSIYLFPPSSTVGQDGPREIQRSRLHRNWGNIISTSVWSWPTPSYDQQEHPGQAWGPEVDLEVLGLIGSVWWPSRQKAHSRHSENAGSWRE